MVYYSNLATSISYTEQRVCCSSADTPGKWGCPLPGHLLQEVRATEPAPCGGGAGWVGGGLSKHFECRAPFQQSGQHHVTLFLQAWILGSQPIMVMNDVGAAAFLKPKKPQKKHHTVSPLCMRTHYLRICLGVKLLLTSLPALLSSLFTIQRPSEGCWNYQNGTCDQCCPL